MPMAFHKIHANGDDFVIIDARGADDEMTSTLAARLADRNRGIGFNQIAIVVESGDADARMIFWNADGSALDVCGSATRGAADMLMREKGTSFVTLQTVRAQLTCRRLSESMISVSMGAPLFGWRQIPLARDMDTMFLPLPGAPTASNMGNPHCTFFVDDLGSIDVAAIGRAIETDPLFPLKTNVHFVQIIDRNRIRLRIWERGGGIPLGSGSCSCGAAVAGIRRGLLDDFVEVECDGGTVTVQWDGTGSVHLAGPIEHVFSGIVADSWLARIPGPIRNENQPRS